MMGNDFCRSEPGAVATAANLRGQFHARNHRRITGIGGVIGGRPVAILALHAFELRRLEGIREARRQSITDGMAGQTTRLVS